VGRIDVSREKYRQYLEILEVGPDASLTQIKKSYLHLKRLYSSENIASSPLEGDFPEERRKEILRQVEEAYAGLLSLLKEEDRKILKKERKLRVDLDEEAEGEEALPLIEKIIKLSGSRLKALNLKKSFNGRPVVKGVELEVRSGEIIGLLGRNGAGKTTTFQMIVGLVRPDEGRITLDKTDISLLSTPQRALRGIIYLPQDNSVFLKASVEDNLRLIWELRRKEKKHKREAALGLLEELGLDQLAGQPAHSLSGGERRKLEICRALLLNPKFLLLDEPFTGIDPLTILDLQKILIKLRNRGIGIILSDHNVRDTLKIADRAYVIDRGEILVEGNPREIAASAKARERFLGNDFKLGEEVSPYSS